MARRLVTGKPTMTAAAQWRSMESASDHLSRDCVGMEPSQFDSRSQPSQEMLAVNVPDSYGLSFHAQHIDTNHIDHVKLFVPLIIASKTDHALTNTGDTTIQDKVRAAAVLHWAGQVGRPLHCLVSSQG